MFQYANRMFGGEFNLISVLTLTYQRHFLLEEAIESFLRQDFSGESEMVILMIVLKLSMSLNTPKFESLM